MDHRQNNRPYVEIIEQPAPRAVRFRYICEGRSAGCIPGVNNKGDHKTFPSIRIVGYMGPAIVVVSCVTKDKPYRAHPYGIVGKDTCKRGVCTIEVIAQNLPISFTNLGIQCVKKKEIPAALKQREEIRVDPFRNGFDHKDQYLGFDLSTVRLCFQVFLEGPVPGRFTIPLEPVVSDPIYDKKTAAELIICKLSHCSAPIIGGMEMIILCEKIVKDDIQVIFFEMQHGQTIWEAYGEFYPTDVHKQSAISFRTPPYPRQQVDQPIQVFIQLRRPSDGETSDALPFMMTPLDAGDPVYAKRKRQKFSTSTVIVEPQQQQQQHQQQQQQQQLQDLCSQFNCNCGYEHARNNAAIDAGASNISKENHRMTLLRRLQTEAEKNEQIGNQLPERECNYVKSGMQYSPMNNNNNMTGINYPNSIYPLNNNNVDSLAPQINQSIKSCQHTPDIISQMIENCYSTSVVMNSPPNAPTHYPPMNQSKCNEPPMLYRITSQNQETTYPYYQQQQQQQPQLINYAAGDATGAMNNEASLDINSMANLYEINSADIDRAVAKLSENFLTSISLTDTSETKDECQHDGIAAVAIENNNNWIG